MNSCTTRGIFWGSPATRLRRSERPVIPVEQGAKPMVGSLIMRGLMIGIVAGLFAFGWAKTFGEQPTSVAIAFEAAQDEAQGKPDEPEIFSRSVQSGIGLFTGIVTVGAGIGGLFGV